MYGISPMVKFTSRVCQWSIKIQVNQAQPTNDLVKINPLSTGCFYSKATLYIYSLLYSRMLSRIAPATRRSVQQAVKPVVQVMNYYYLQHHGRQPNSLESRPCIYTGPFCFYQACCHSSRYTLKQAYTLDQHTCYLAPKTVCSCHCWYCRCHWSCLHVCRQRYLCQYGR